MSRVERALYRVTVASMACAVGTLFVPLIGPVPAWLNGAQVAFTVIILVGVLGYVTVAGARR